MAEAFAAVPARILWKLTPGEAEALAGAGLGSNTKVSSVLYGRVALGLRSASPWGGRGGGRVHPREPNQGRVWLDYG